MSVRVEPSADVSDRASLGEGTSVWHLAQVREDAVLGPGCIVGRGAYVGTGVRMGANCKLQNYALVYEPAVLEDGVFVGPAAVFTNDQYPRAVAPDGSLKRGEHWEAVGVTCREGASIGARAVCVAPVTIGRWAMVAAGSVVIKDVPDFALVAGVPARRVRWVGRAGVPLEIDVDGEPEGERESEPGGGGDGDSHGDGHGEPVGEAGSRRRWRCPQTGRLYVEENQTLRETSTDA